MIQTKDKFIDGHNVVVTQHPALRANALKVRLVKLLGVPFANLLGSLALGGRMSLGSVLDGSIDFPAAISALTEKLDPAEYEVLILEVLAMTHMDNRDLSKKDVFNDVFAGNLVLMYKVALFVLEVNFGDFFALIPSGKSQTEGTEQSPS